MAVFRNSNLAGPGAETGAGFGENLSPTHTADADETKLSSLVASASVVCT